MREEEDIRLKTDPPADSPFYFDFIVESHSELLINFVIPTKCLRPHIYLLTFIFSACNGHIKIYSFCVVAMSTLSAPVLLCKKRKIYIFQFAALDVR